jgi:hypothetical protein
MVLEGVARQGMEEGVVADGVDIVHAAHGGDDTLVGLAEAGGEDVILVSADRTLNASGMPVAGSSGRTGSLPGSVLTYECIRGQAINRRRISGSNASTADPRLIRRYSGGVSDRNAERTVFRAIPVRRTISLIDNPSARCGRRISAQSSTSNISFLRLGPAEPGSAHQHPQWWTGGQGGSEFAGDKESVFSRR